MSAVDKNIAATQKLFEAFGAKNIPEILKYLDPDVVVEFYGPSVIPYAGTYTGIVDAERFFETVLSSVEIQSV